MARPHGSSGITAESKLEDGTHISTDPGGELDIPNYIVEAINGQVHSVDGVELDIPRYDEVHKGDEVVLHAEHSHNGISRKTCNKSKSHTVDPQIGKYIRYINPLAAAVHIFPFGPIYLPKSQVIHLDDVINRRIKCYCVNHSDTSLIAVYFKKLGSLSFPVTMTA